MSSKHTPGPWAVNPLCAQVDAATLSKLGGLLPIAQMLWPTDERSEAETEANARLISAAPDLLEALTTVMREFFPHPTPGEYPELTAARAAIAKATGDQS